MAITTSLTVAPMAFFTSFTEASDVDRKAKRRCAVMVALNGVSGAMWVGRGPAMRPSGPRSRPMLSTVPSGPRRLLRSWPAAATSTGLRVARPTSRAVRAPSTSARPGLRSSPTPAWASTSASVRARSGTHGSASSSAVWSQSTESSNIMLSSSAPEAPSTVAWWILLRIPKVSSGSPSIT